MDYSVTQKRTKNQTQVSTDTKIEENKYGKHVVKAVPPGRYMKNSKCVLLQHILIIDTLSIYSEIALSLRWTLQDFTEDKSTLVQLAVCCLTAPSLYLNPRWPISML